MKSEKELMKDFLQQYKFWKEIYCEESLEDEQTYNEIKNLKEFNDYVLRKQFEEASSGLIKCLSKLFKRSNKELKRNG